MRRKVNGVFNWSFYIVCLNQLSKVLHDNNNNNTFVSNNDVFKVPNHVQ